MSDRSVPKIQLPDILPTDPVLADLLPDFARLWLRDLDGAVERCRMDNDAESLHRLGHTIKGSFLQFGFTELSAVGVQIMNAALAKDWEGAQAHVTALRSVLEQLQQRLSGSAS